MDLTSLLSVNQPELLSSYHPGEAQTPEIVMNKKPGIDFARVLLKLLNFDVPPLQCQPHQRTKDIAVMLSSTIVTLPLASLVLCHVLGKGVLQFGK